VHLTTIRLVFSSASNLGLASTANEDTYLTIKDIDGTKWADKLRARMRTYTVREGAAIAATERNSLLQGATPNLYV